MLSHLPGYTPLAAPSHLGGFLDKTEHVDALYEQLQYHYIRIPRTQITLISRVFSAPVTPGEYLRRGTSRNKAAPVNRVAHLAKSLRLGVNTSLLLYYTGQDARKVFKRDFVRFAHNRSAKLLAFDDSPGIPVIVLQDALIPLANVMKRHAYSRLMMFYIDYHLQSQTERPRYHDYSEIWINPRTGGICTGIPGPRLDYTWEASPTHPAGKKEFASPLPIQVLGDEKIMVKYLTECFTDSTFLSSCYLIHKRDFEVDWRGLTTESKLRLLPGSAVSLSEKTVIAWSKYPSDQQAEKAWRIWESSTRPELCSRSEETLKDGRKRYSFPQEFQDWDKVIFRYKYVTAKNWYSNAAAWWLSQALSILSQSTVHCQPAELAIIHGVDIMVTMVRDLQVSDGDARRACSSHKATDLQSNHLTHLFLTPPPNRWGINEVVSWMSKSEDLYYWSFSPDGSPRLSEVDRQELGLPRLVIGLVPIAQTLRPQMYSSTLTWQQSKKFNPTTTDFSKHLRFPTMEVEATGPPGSRDLLQGDDSHHNALNKMSRSTSTATITQQMNSAQAGNVQKHTPETRVFGVEDHIVSHVGNGDINHYMLQTSRMKPPPRVAISHDDDLVPLLKAPGPESVNWPTRKEFVDRLHLNFDFIESTTHRVIYTQQKHS